MAEPKTTSPPHKYNSNCYFHYVYQHLIGQSKSHDQALKENSGEMHSCSCCQEATAGVWIYHTATGEYGVGTHNSLWHIQSSQPLSVPRGQPLPLRTLIPASARDALSHSSHGWLLFIFEPQANIIPFQSLPTCPGKEYNRLRGTRGIISATALGSHRIEVSIRGIRWPPKADRG